MFWNSSAPEDDGRRERFSGPFAVFGIIAAFTGLLALFYPEQMLLSLLHSNREQNPTTRTYLGSLLKVRPYDHQSRLALARIQLETGDYAKAIRTLDESVGNPPAAEKSMYMAIRYQALAGLIRKEPSKENVRRFELAADQMLKEASSTRQVRMVVADAENAKLSALADRGRALILKMAPGTPESGGAYDYQKRAEAFFEAMSSATDIGRRREFFIKGVRTLQSGNMLKEAIDAADRHLGGLNGDRETMMVLARVALAAGRPDKAQKYVRLALGMKGE